MEENLKELIRLFYEDKKLLDNYKKSTDEYNKQIKKDMTDLGKSEFETDDGIIAKLSVQNRESFNDDLLLKKITELDIPGIIKTKQYVDMDALEDAIYNGQLDASELSSCKVVNQVTVLKVSKRKD